MGWLEDTERLECIKKLLSRRKILVVTIIPILIIAAFAAVYLFQIEQSTTVTSNENDNTTVKINANTTVITYGGTWSVPTVVVSKIVNSTWMFTVTVQTLYSQSFLSVYSNLTYISHRNSTYAIAGPIAADLSVYKQGRNETLVWSLGASSTTSPANVSYGKSYSQTNDIPSSVLQNGVNYSIQDSPGIDTYEGTFIGDQLGLNISYVPNFITIYTSSLPNTNLTTISPSSGEYDSIVGQIMFYGTFCAVYGIFATTSNGSATTTQSCYGTNVPQPNFTSMILHFNSPSGNYTIVPNGTGHFEGSLSASTYTVRMDNCEWYSCSKIFPASITVCGGSPTLVNITISTEIQGYTFYSPAISDSC